MRVREMISTHPDVQGSTADRLLQFIEEAYSCAQTCTACADACLAEPMVDQLRQCIRLRGRKEGEEADRKRKEKWMAAAGIGALAVGAYFTVFSTEKIVSAIGISKIIGGLFITAPVAALPEVFATGMSRVAAR